MTAKSECKEGGPRLPNGNCTKPGPDDLPVQCVGAWVHDKHDYLRRYIEATSSVRAAYLEPKGSRPAGGAAYLDLFAGPGRARVRETGEIVDGSPLLALAHERAPFTRAILCDLDPDNVRALLQRTKTHSARTRVVQGDCNAEIDALVDLVPAYGLNIALIDPYGLRPLKFATLGKLATVKRMDLVIHFPTADLKRNLHLNGTKALIDSFLGTARWRSLVKLPSEVVTLIDVLKEQLGTLGYGTDDVRSLPIVNSKKNVIYHLVYASKHPRGDKIWNSVARTTSVGQRGLFE